MELYNADGTYIVGAISGSEDAYTSIQKETWTQIIMVWNNDTETLSMYNNFGNSMDQNCSSTDISTNFAPLYLGSRSDGSQFWKGDIDDVIFYERALDAAEIAALKAYNQ